MAFIAGITVVLIIIHIIMISIDLRFIIMFVTIDTAEDHVIAWIGVTIRALIPFTPVITAVNRKILIIMIEGCRGPSILTMT